MSWKSQEQVLDNTFHKIFKNKLPCPAFRAFLVEFQVLFQVVGNGGEVHCLVGLLEPYGIYLAKSHELR